MSQDSTTRAVVQRMRDERYRRKWSGEQLEEAMRSVGVTFPRSVVANLENHRRDHITIEEIIGLTQVFNTSAQWLVYGTGITCTACKDQPPEGFTCNDCGRSTAGRGSGSFDNSAWQKEYVTT